MNRLQKFLEENERTKILIIALDTVGEEFFAQLDKISSVEKKYVFFVCSKLNEVPNIDAYKIDFVFYIIDPSCKANLVNVLTYIRDTEVLGLPYCSCIVVNTSEIDTVHRKTNKLIEAFRKNYQIPLLSSSFKTSAALEALVQQMINMLDQNLGFKTLPPLAFWILNTFSNYESDAISNL